MHASQLLFNILLVGFVIGVQVAVANDTITDKPSRESTEQQIVTKLLVLGDSLSAGYGLAKKDGWVSKLKQRLATSTQQTQVVNASVSGETSFGGLTRLPALLDRHNPDIVIIELGGNDGLQGLAVSNMEKNLDNMVTLIKKRASFVLLIGMKLPPNYGQSYTHAFEDVYRRLAKKYSIELVPFMLKDIATHRNLMQTDGIHPRAEAQLQILDNIWPHLNKLLKKQVARCIQCIEE